MRKILVLFLLVTTSVFCSEKPTQITLWHAFDGCLKEVFEEIISDFNYQSETYFISPKMIGNYNEVFQQGLDAFEKGNPPHILQVYEVATLTAMEKKGMFIPLEDLMSSYNKRFDPDVYIDAVRAFYTSPSGMMMSLPWNASTGILFYNKLAFSQAGLHPEKPPETWEKLESCSEALKDAGYIGFTTAWPAGYHLELFSAWHNLAFATHGNGFENGEAKLIFNGPVQTKHISKVAEWKKKGYFAYAGREKEEPEALFTEGKCAILLQSGNRLPLIKRKANFPIGVGYMPYWAYLVAKPYNLPIGGSSFWVIKGFSDKEYRGIVQFFDYLSSTVVQAYWHQQTGYLPITDAAYHLTKKKKFYEDHQAAEIAVLEVLSKPPTPYTRGIHLPGYLEVREKIIDCLEEAFEGALTAKEALDKAVTQGNMILDQNRITLQKEEH
ncbi:MAG: sn-glycerol-3-phosphate-binding periplasmic protein UgpB [Chlamydiae bacterium]|nr:sn-glycerol-3-phosphate-binding periplasmic protein UgpB [Chlamydiota bacterium]